MGRPCVSLNVKWHEYDKALDFYIKKKHQYNADKGKVFLVVRMVSSVTMRDPMIWRLMVCFATFESKKFH